MGRKSHAAWAGFERIIDPNNTKATIAKCRKCKNVMKNTCFAKLREHSNR